MSQYRVNVIVHISHSNIEYDSRILKELEALKDLYSTFAIGTNIHSSDLKKPIDNVYTFNINKLRLKSLRPFSTVICYFFYYLYALGKLLILRPTIVHVHDYIMLPLAVFYNFLKFNDVKIIYDAHELESHTNGLTKCRQKIIYQIEKLLLKQIDYLITVSTSIKEWYYTKLYSGPSQIIYNYPQVSVGNSSIDLKKRFSVDGFLFMYLGAFMPGRGISIIIDTFKNLPKKYEVVFMGYGVLENEIIEASKKNINIHYQEKVPHDEVVDVASTADYGLCLIETISLSDYYALPNKLFEYLASSLPVITSNNKELKTFINKHSVGVCINPTVENLTKLIISESYPVCSPEALKHIEDEYSWEKQQEKLQSIYKDILM